MTPLERRYRRLLHLLPAAHRAARGEELLGLLLDLDEGRSRPSARQTLGLVALAARLRLAGLAPAATILFSAFLVAYGTAQIGLFVDAYTGGSAAGHRTWITYLVEVLLTPAAVQLAVPVAWVLGNRRAALVLQAAVPVSVLVSHVVLNWGNPAASVLGDLPQAVALALVLAVAVRRRWATPRPRGLWVAAVPVAVLAWKGTWVWGRHGMYYPTVPAYFGWATAMVAAAAALILLRRRRWPMVIVGVLVGTAVGRYLPSVLVHLVYGEYGWLLSLTVGIAALVGGATFAARQRPTPVA